MADVNGVYYDNHYVDSPATQSASALVGGEMQFMYDEYEASGLSIGDEILVGFKLPASAVIHDIIIINDALGASTTLAAATRTLDDGTESVFLSAQSTSSAGRVTPDGSDIDTLPAQPGEPFEVILQLAGGSATGTIKVWVKYSEH